MIQDPRLWGSKVVLVHIIESLSSHIIINVIIVTIIIIILFLELWNKTSTYIYYWGSL